LKMPCLEYRQHCGLPCAQLDSHCLQPLELASQAARSLAAANVVVWAVWAVLAAVGNMAACGCLPPMSTLTSLMIFAGVICQMCLLVGPALAVRQLLPQVAAWPAEEPESQTTKRQASGGISAVAFLSWAQRLPRRSDAMAR